MMKKALAQNPNLLRTLIGLSLTLIFLLSYAVYGATVSPSAYIYTTDATVTTTNSLEQSDDVVRLYDEDSNITVWAWQVSADGQNLTWVNVSVSDMSDGSVLKVTNNGKLYSHPQLGATYTLENPLEEEFSCAELCFHNLTHERISTDGEDLAFFGLTSVDPARRSNGSVFAQSLAEARVNAANEVNYTHSPSAIRIEVIEQGNRTTQPFIEIETVNEELANVEVFSVDAATEFVWALAAVVGCFSIVLIPSFTVYFAAQAKERRDEAKLALAKETVEQSLTEK
ncbi:MAG: hypothetical protein CMA10_02065 [Euryarchaeota archaeon]|nr:hypothetical protein [Euryarchaeota archaeon]|tara:strand:- start:14625 stop:15476 length:852 start_codon:yes stop_codon:yes gene_type:complete